MKAKRVAADTDEPAEWAMLTHALRIELSKSYRVTFDWLSEIPGILNEIGLTRLPRYTVFHDWFARISITIWRAFLGTSAEKHTGHAAIDSTGRLWLLPNVRGAVLLALPPRRVPNTKLTCRNRRLENPSSRHTCSELLLPTIE